MVFHEQFLKVLWYGEKDKTTSTNQKGKAYTVTIKKDFNHICRSNNIELYLELFKPLMQ